MIDEDIPLSIRDALIRLGHDVTRVALGAQDRDVLANARDDERILITFDRDFGDLIIRRGAPAPPGVIYVRRHPSPREAAQLVVALLDSEIEVDGHFTVVDHNRTRQRALPRSNR